jgi:hypothetical protein
MLVFTLLWLADLVGLRADGSLSPEERQTIRTNLAELVDSVTAATWVQETWERLGEKEELTRARCHWNGDRLRLDVEAGRGKGSTAILYQGKVYGFKRGLLSFVKLKYEPRDRAVLSLRGNDLRGNGYLDDVRFALEHWDNVEIAPSERGLVLAYRDAAGLRQRLQLAGDGLDGPEPLHVAEQETFEGEELVARATYEDVVYNPEFDEKLLVP